MAEKITKEDLDKLGEVFLGALKDLKDSVDTRFKDLELKKEEWVNPENSDNGDQTTCMCFLGAKNGNVIPPLVSQVITKDIRFLMDKYGLNTVVAMMVPKR